MPLTRFEWWTESFGGEINLFRRDTWQPFDKHYYGRLLTTHSHLFILKLILKKNDLQANPLNRYSSPWIHPRRLVFGILSDIDEFDNWGHVRTETFLFICFFFRWCELPSVRVPPQIIILTFYLIYRSTTNIRILCFVGHYKIIRLNIYLPI